MADLTRRQLLGLLTGLCAVRALPEKDWRRHIIPAGRAVQPRWHRPVHPAYRLRRYRMEHLESDIWQMSDSRCSMR